MRAADRDKVARAYRRTFCGVGEVPHVDAALILEDLRRFCRVTKGGLEITRAGEVDPYATLYANGLRDAYARILGFIEYEPAVAAVKDTSHVSVDDEDSAG